MDMVFGHAVHEVTAGERRAPARPAPAEFRVDVLPVRGGVRVRPVGEIDLATIDRLREHVFAAMAAGEGLVILDLRETTFLDSTGLRLTLEADARAAGNRIEFAMIAGPPAVQRTFDMAGLTARLPFVDVPRA
jgi:anti-anti-sigma factor